MIKRLPCLYIITTTKDKIKIGFSTEKERDDAYHQLSHCNSIWTSFNSLITIRTDQIVTIIPTKKFIKIKSGNQCSV